MIVGLQFDECKSLCFLILLLITTFLIIHIKYVKPASIRWFTAHDCGDPSRAGLKGRGARGNFYWRAPMKYFMTSPFIKVMFSLIGQVPVCFFQHSRMCLLKCTHS